VLRGNEVWEFILMLREIGNLLCARSIQRKSVAYLSVLIEEFCELFVALFKEGLKPKFHNMVHYPGIILKSGPLVHLWSIRHEGKNKELKGSLQGNESKVNVARSIAVKTQLYQVSLLIGERRNFFKVALKRDGVFLPVEKVPVELKSSNGAFFEKGCLTVKKIELKGTEYQVGMILVLECDNIPSFGTIRQIFLNEVGEVLFLCNRLITHELDEHYDAFVVSSHPEQSAILSCDVFSHVPLWKRNDVQGRSLVMLKVAL